mmetsp:Transcript_16001/g.41413  ORF Transcript_16001/g.41413 Transcript_16001/m.41413 type:complete len:459 (-) Transcript_16001:16-1392(-)
MHPLRFLRGGRPDRRDKLLLELRVGGVVRGQFPTVLFNHSPVGEPRAPLKLRQHFRDIDELHRTLRLAEEGRHHRFVLDGVERACRVHEPPANTKELRTAIHDLRLDLVEPDSVHRIPILPHGAVLPHGAIARARHVAKHPIEEQLGGLPRRGGIRYPERRESGGIEVGHHKVGRLQPLRLMRQSVAPLVLNIVGNHHPRRRGVASVQHLDELCCLRAWCRAHVEHSVLWLHIEEQRRDHRHRLLPTEISFLVHCHQKLVKIVERALFSQCASGHIHLPRQVIGVEFDGVGWGDVLTVKHQPFHLREESRLEHLAEFHRGRLGSCNPERRGQHLTKFCHEHVPLKLLCCYSAVSCAGGGVRGTRGEEGHQILRFVVPLESFGFEGNLRPTHVLVITVSLGTSPLTFPPLLPLVVPPHGVQLLLKQPRGSTEPPPSPHHSSQPSCSFHLALRHCVGGAV